MNINRYRTIFCILVFFYILMKMSLNAQSIFSFKGVGESVLSGDAHMSALGYAEIPVSFSSNLCGSIALFDMTGVNITYYGMRLQMSDGEGENVMHYYGIPRIKATTTLPLGLSFDFSIRKFMDFNANFTVRPDSVNGVLYEGRFLKKGQLSLGRVEIAKKIGNDVGVGFGIDVLFGGSDEVWITDFSDTSYFDTRDSLTNNYLGYSYSLGIAFRFQPVSFNIGYSFPVSCETQTKSLSYFRKDTVLSEDELVFPSLYTCGCAVSAGENFNLLFTVRYKDWSNFKYVGSKFPSGFSDVLSYSIGLEYIGTKGYKKRGFPLRIGYFSKPWYFKDSYDEKIVDNGFTVGTSVPVLKKYDFVDIAFIAGMRNTIELKERFYGFQLSFNFYERW